MSKDGGYLVPESVYQSLIDTATTTGTIWRGFIRTPVPPLTFAQRVRGRIWRLRYAIANAIYPYPAYED